MGRDLNNSVEKGLDRMAVRAGRVCSCRSVQLLDLNFRRCSNVGEGKVWVKKNGEERESGEGKWRKGKRGEKEKGGREKFYLFIFYFKSNFGHAYLRQNTSNFSWAYIYGKNHNASLHSG